jgi:hypothetical protein
MKYSLAKLATLQQMMIVKYDGSQHAVTQGI